MLKFIQAKSEDKVLLKCQWESLALGVKEQTKNNKHWARFFRRNIPKKISEIKIEQTKNDLGQRFLCRKNKVLTKAKMKDDNYDL